MSPARRRELREAIAIIDDRVAAACNSALTVAELIGRFGGRLRFTCGADELRLLGIAATCTTTHHGLLMGWKRAAERRLAKEHAT